MLLQTFDFDFDRQIDCEGFFSKVMMPNICSNNLKIVFHSYQLQIVTQVCFMGCFDFCQSLLFKLSYLLHLTAKVFRKCILVESFSDQVEIGVRKEPSTQDRQTKLENFLSILGTYCSKKSIPAATQLKFCLLLSSWVQFDL